MTEDTRFCVCQYQRRSDCSRGDQCKAILAGAVTSTHPWVVFGRIAGALTISVALGKCAVLVLRHGQ